MPRARSLLRSRGTRRYMRQVSAITTHVLDTSRGRPAAGVAVTVEAFSGGRWKRVARARTDRDGRVPDLLPEGIFLRKGRYRLTFDTGRYVRGFYPSVTVEISIRDPKAHYHIPLLLSPYGYSTYRGS